MRRGKGLARKTPLRQGDKPLQTRRPLERRTTLRAVSERRLQVVPDAPVRQPGRRSGFTPASPAQRAKAKEQGCRFTAAHEYDEDLRLPVLLIPGSVAIDPAHITDRALGGCDDELCVVGLRRDIHQLYDMGKFDLLPYLTKAEQAHAVEHVGLVSALQAITGQRWAPVEDDGPRGVAA